MSEEISKDTSHITPRPHTETHEDGGVLHTNILCCLLLIIVQFSLNPKLPPPYFYLTYRCLKLELSSGPSEYLRNMQHGASAQLGSGAGSWADQLTQAQCRAWPGIASWGQ